MPRNKYPEATRNKILEAAIKTFEEKGYDKTTILDIVSNMEGLTRGAFYHHFKSKEEVFTAVTNKILYNQNPFDIVKKEKGLNGLQKLRKAVQISISSLDDEYKTIRMESVALLNSPHFLHDQVTFLSVASREYIQPLIEEGIADGSITVEDPLHVSELFMIFFNFWFLPTIFDGDAKYMEKKAELSMHILESLGLPIYNDEFEEFGNRFIEAMNDLQPPEDV